MNKSSFNADIILAVRLDFIRPHDQGSSGKVYNLVPRKTPGAGPWAWKLIISLISEGALIPHQWSSLFIEESQLVALPMLRCSSVSSKHS